MTDEELEAGFERLRQENAAARAKKRNSVDEVAELWRERAAAETPRRVEALAAEYRRANPGITPEETRKRVEALAAEYRRNNPGVTPEETWKRIEALAAESRQARMRTLEDRVARLEERLERSATH